MIDMPRADLPVGSYVHVSTYYAGKMQPAFRAKVVGYDIGRSKYHLGMEYLPGLFSDGGWWAFPSEVELITEEET